MVASSTDLERTRFEGNTAPVVSLDVVSGTFVFLPHVAVLCKLHTCGEAGQIYSFIEAFLRDQSFVVHARGVIGALQRCVHKEVS